MKPRIIVCGLGRTGYKVYSLLKQQGAMVVGINNHPYPLLEPEIAAGSVVIGDMCLAATLIAAGIQDAQTLVLATSDDALNLAALTQARVLNPRIRIVNRLFNASLGDRLDHILPDHFSMSVAALSAPVFAFAALGKRAIGQLRLFNQTWPIREEYIDDHHPWRGRKLSELWEDRSRMLIYYLPAHNQMDLVSAVLCGKTLQVGDRLIIATQPQSQAVRRNFRQKMLSVFMSFRYFQQHIRPAIVVTFILLVTIIIATLTYTAANAHISVIDALYFSVGMITGAGGGEDVAEKAPDDIKLFTVLMMLIGAAVVGIFYALLNDFILGTRFREFWDTARVPHRNHFVICGLGGVGVQILNQLRANGFETVVIERDPTNRFLNVARSLRVPVIQGDANLATILQAAHVTGASAVLAVTNSDVVNLEIALTVKGLAPKVPVIVRNQNPQFAPLAQQVFDFEAVLSPVELAAPSFAAAALGGRVLGNGMTANILWVALSTLITPAHPFCGKLIKDIAMDSDLVPLFLETKRQTTHGWNLLDVELNPGDVLYLTMPATHLEQLWRNNLAPLIVQLNH
ncbi:MAG: potassium channel protein [Cyanobacteria bacterium CRU_2_1]|nr:potassium channel protein [Cyanobacteria bacterium RU_5_0]NJR60812.1 potassium channel protein [Cyanobacteria bacterium CRU_2_1]